MNTQAVSLKWATPDGDAMIAELARVSNPANQGNTETAPRLIAYCIRNQHWSIFEMASMCVEINTTRDIGRQILRHRSFSFQEFSQRYADVSALGDPVYREARMQDSKNRQASNPTDDSAHKTWWGDAQAMAWDDGVSTYKTALSRGIAKEQARAVLPEGMTPTRMYMVGNVRSWIHYCSLRTTPGTQKEHRDIAIAAWATLSLAFPLVAEAVTQNLAAQTGKERRTQDALTLLKQAGEQFRSYAEQHSVKGTPDGDRKALTNAALAEQIEKMLKDLG
jgi:thymidylate synthase (FAD)